MSKSKAKIDDKQITIFEYLRSLSEQSHLNTPSNEGQFKVISQLRVSLKAAIKDCSLSRHQFAKRNRRRSARGRK